MTAGASNITVTTSDGTSNSIPFYCRTLGSNHIYFISPTGSDSNNGLYSTNTGGSNGPWLSANKARNGVMAGDAVYFKAGIWTTVDNWGATIDFWNNNHANGTANNSITVAAYPGEIAQLGNSTSVAGQIYTFGHHGSAGDALNYWTFSKLVMRANLNVVGWASNNAPISDDHLRFIGNDMQTTAGTGKTVVSFDGGTGGETNLYFYGNYIHDAGVNTRGEIAAQRGYSLYFGGYGSHNYIYVGWNEMCYNTNGRGMQVFGHTVTDTIDNIYIHDNYIHDNSMTGIVFSGGDGGTGAGGAPSGVAYEFVKNLWFYNNIVADNGASNYPAIFIDGGQTWGGMGGNFHIYNNTLYQNIGEEIGIFYTTTGPTSVVIKNNILYNSTQYYSISGGVENCTRCTASNNIYYGNALTKPTWDSTSTTGNPLFIVPAPSSFLDFKLQSLSLAIDAGINLIATVTKDFLGVSRPQGSTFDIGAFEYDTGAPPTSDATPPSAPTGLVVN